VTIDVVTQITRDALFLIVKTAAPVLMISLVIGLIISVFQTATSIQEQTLTFVPKVICVFLGLMVFGHWMLNSIVDYMVILWTDFSLYIR